MEPVRTALAVGVVLEQFQPNPQPAGRLRRRPQDDRVPGQVVRGGVRRIGRLRRGVLGMSMVDIEPGTVTQDAVVGLGERRRPRAGVAVDDGEIGRAHV